MERLEPLRRRHAADRPSVQDGDGPITPGKVTCIPLAPAGDVTDDALSEIQVEAEGGAEHGEMAAEEALQADGAEDEEGEEIVCNAPGCRTVCHSVREYEDHYDAAHKHACAECHRSFPNDRLLDLHITERHDPFFQVLSERQPMYGCLVEGCEGMFKTERARHLHLTDKHHFPRDFDFDGMGRTAPSPHKKGPGKARPREAEGAEEEAPAEEGGETAVGDISPAKVPRCKYHNAPGGCKRGDACRFVHGPKRRAPKEGVNADMEVEELEALMQSRLRLLPKEVTFGRHARGRSRKLEKPGRQGGEAVGMDEDA